jgi:hypothetical protein
LDFGLDVVNSVRWLDIECDGLAYHLRLQQHEQRATNR